MSLYDSDARYFHVSLMGPLIDKQAVARFEAALAKVRENGGELLCGGRVLSRPGNFVEPAIVRARNDWSIVQTETSWPAKASRTRRWPDRCGTGAWAVA